MPIYINRFFQLKMQNCTIGRVTFPQGPCQKPVFKDSTFAQIIPGKESSPGTLCWFYDTCSMGMDLKKNGHLRQFFKWLAESLSTCNQTFSRIVQRIIGNTEVNPKGPIKIALKSSPEFNNLFKEICTCNDESGRMNE